MFKKMAIQTSLILFLFLSFRLEAGTCTADSRTNVSANSVLTSTKYNTDLNTVYNRLNGNLDGGCITDDTVEAGALQTDSVTTVKIIDDAVTIAKIGSGAMGASVVSKTGAYTLTSSDDVVIADASGANFTITLPTAVGIQGKRYKIKNETTDETYNVLLDGAGSETIDGLAGYYLYGTKSAVEVISDNANWEIIGNRATGVVYLKEVQTNGTEGGGCTSGSWATRTLNTVTGTDGMVTLSSNAFTLQPGIYTIEAMSPGYEVQGHKAKLRNTTDSTDDIIGTSMFTNVGSNINTYSYLFGTINISTAKTYEIQFRCEITAATNGLGHRASTGVSEVYTQVKITKLL
jgi:hypothetical protein